MKKSVFMGTLLLSVILSMSAACSKPLAPPSEADDHAPIQSSDPGAPGESQGSTSSSQETPDNMDVSDTMDGPLAEGDASIEGILVQVHDTRIRFMEPYGGNGSLYDFSPEEISILDPTGNETTLSALRTGMHVRLNFDGYIQETYPALIPSPVRLQVLEQKPDLLGFYLDIIQTIYDMDPALNDGVRILAFDLSGITNLTEGEKNALLWEVQELPVFSAMEVRQGDFDTLSGEGLINKVHLEFEKGLLFTISDTALKQDHFTFSIKKWRSGTGSLGYDDIEVRFEEDHFSYTLENGWIS